MPTTTFFVVLFDGGHGRVLMVSYFVLFYFIFEDVTLQQIVDSLVFFMD